MPNSSSRKTIRRTNKFVSKGTRKHHHHTSKSASSKATVKYRILQLEDVHKGYHAAKKNNKQYIIEYYWSDGSDPNKDSRDTHKYNFTPNGNLIIGLQDKKGHMKFKTLKGYLDNPKLRLPYKANKPAQSDVMFALSGRMFSNEPGNKWEADNIQMQICHRPLNALSDTCISGPNWVLK